MKARTEEFLYHLLYHCEQLTQPTFRNLTGSFESWAYRNGFHRQLQALERRKMLEARGGEGARPDLDRAFKLTEAGRLAALGGRDPQAWWNHVWDGKWRLVVFDIPNRAGKLRERLRKMLRQYGYGKLQNSVWIGPRPIDQTDQNLTRTKVDVSSLIFLDARPSAGESDAEIVAGAWEFKRINRRYSEYLKVLAARPKKALTDEASAESFRAWANRERKSWLRAVDSDPLLPHNLLPSGYLGQKAWNQRIKTLSTASNQITSFAVDDQ